VMNSSLIRPVDSGNSSGPPARCPETGFAEMSAHATFDEPSLHTTGLQDNFECPIWT
jgi:hypothetical protein